MGDDDTQAAAAALAAAIVAALPPPPAPIFASALTTINVKTHIPFALELDPPNYSTWRELFQTLVGHIPTAVFLNFRSSLNVRSSPS